MEIDYNNDLFLFFKIAQRNNCPTSLRWEKVGRDNGKYTREIEANQQQQQQTINKCHN